MDPQLNNEATLDSSRYQLSPICSINKQAFLDQAHVKRHVFDAVKVLIKDEKPKVLRACEVQVPLFAVADAADLAVRLIKTFWLRQVLCVTELESCNENFLASLWVPHMNALFVIWHEASVKRRNMLELSCFCKLTLHLGCIEFLWPPFCDSYTQPSYSNWIQGVGHCLSSP